MLTSKGYRCDAEIVRRPVPRRHGAVRAEARLGGRAMSKPAGKYWWVYGSRCKPLPGVRFFSRTPMEGKT